MLKTGLISETADGNDDDDDYDDDDGDDEGDGDDDHDDDDDDVGDDGDDDGHRSRCSFDIRLAIFGIFARGRTAISSRMLVLRQSFCDTWSEICGIAKLRYVRCMAHGWFH